MTRDRLDAMLDRSTPAVSEADPADLRAMIAAAKQQTRPTRHRRLGVVAGVLSLALVGGAGVATASSTWEWGAGMESNRSYTYTSPNWGECELRQGNFIATNPLRQFELDRVIDEWFATASVRATVEPLIGTYLDAMEDAQTNEPESIADLRVPDLNYWTAVDQAVAEALHAQLLSQGFEQGSVTNSASQVHCDGEQW